MVKKVFRNTFIQLLITASLSILLRVNAQIVSTFAGSGNVGSNDGINIEASFNNPNGLAVDIQGNVYVADYGNNKIRKITPTGIVSTFAGSGNKGSVNGIGVGASFNGPRGVAIDKVGNIYVADANNHLIRKITPEGVVSTLAGSGKSGLSDGGGGSPASFFFPHDITIDALGNVFVADDGNHIIRKITPQGAVSPYGGLARGTGGFSDDLREYAAFYGPTGVSIDFYGNVYVADKINHKIRKITSDSVKTVAGGSFSGSNNGIGTNASFQYPHDVTLDANGNIYVADTYNHKIRKITQQGMVSTFAGSGNSGKRDGLGSIASFNFPRGVAVDATGNVYVGDTENHLIRKISFNELGIENEYGINNLTYIYNEELKIHVMGLNGRIAYIIDSQGRILGNTKDVFEVQIPGVYLIQGEGFQEKVLIIK